MAVNHIHSRPNYVFNNGTLLYIYAFTEVKEIFKMFHVQSDLSGYVCDTVKTPAKVNKLSLTCILSS